MDVKKAVSFIFFPLLINCTPEAPPPSTFQKSSLPRCDEQVIQGEYIVNWKDGRTTIETAENDKKFFKNFLEKNEQDISFAEPHYEVTPLEGSFVQQRDWGGALNWGADKVHAADAWDSSFKGQGVIVAIIDSGFDTTHPELQDVMAINPNEEINGIDDDENGLIDDYYGYDFAEDTSELVDYTGHGTHVAGVVAAQHDAGSVTGVAPEAKILPLTFIKSNGKGSVGAALDAIKYSIERKAKVINASWGGDGCSLTLRDEIKNLAEHNILFVSASGNRGNNLKFFPEYPAAFSIDNQIAVGASTADNYTAAFSNYGDEVSLVAPGAYIISTYPAEFDIDGTADGLVALNGTSMAAPFVAGAAAVLWSKNPDASYQDIKKALLEGVQSGPYPVATRGQLDIKRSLELLPEASTEQP